MHPKRDFMVYFLTELSTMSSAHTHILSWHLGVDTGGVSGHEWLHCAGPSKMLSHSLE